MKMVLSIRRSLANKYQQYDSCYASHVDQVTRSWFMIALECHYDCELKLSCMNKRNSLMKMYSIRTSSLTSICIRSGHQFVKGSFYWQERYCLCIKVFISWVTRYFIWTSGYRPPSLIAHSPRHTAVFSLDQSSRVTWHWKHRYSRETLLLSCVQAMIYIISYQSCLVLSLSV